MFALALMVYAADRAVGANCVLVSVVAALLDDAPSGYRGKTLRRARALDLESRVGAKPYIARSYAQGTTPAHGYVLPSGPLTIRVRQQPNGVDTASGKAKMFVWSTGAPTPRPISPERNERGLWKATEWSSPEVDVLVPRTTQDDL